MTPAEAIANLSDAFNTFERPTEFIRGTCYCAECLEHNQTLASHNPETITLAELGNPAWDPMCFASDQAFAYYLPALIRLAFGPDSYLDQLLFHLNTPGRLNILDEKQARALLDALWVLIEIKGEEIAANLDESALEQVLEKLEQGL